MRAIDYARELFKFIDMDNPPVVFDDILDKFNIKVFYDDFDNIDGIALKSPKLGIIVINRNLSFVRQRFTIAHELGHLVMPHRGEYYICYTGRNKVMERTANRFAAELLMPKPMVVKLLKKYSTNRDFQIDVVAHILQVSKSALYARLRELNIKRSAPFA